MADVSLPMIGATRAATPSSAASAKPAKDDQTVAVNAMVKTLNATVTKLLFSFSALNAASTESSTGSIELALKAAKREELSAKIVDALTGTVEKVVRCEKAAVRSSVLRDLRARFTVAEKPKPEMIDCGSQTAARKSKAATAAAAVDKANDDAILRQLRAPPPAAAAAPPPPPAQSSTCFITAATSARDQAEAEAAPAASRPATVNSISSTAGADDALGKEPLPRPASGSSSRPNGIYERQMQWAAKAAAHKEKLRVEKENKEREAEQPVAARPKSGRWAHVESVMRKQRLQAEESWKSDMKEQMEGERERRDQAEAKLRDERMKAEALAAAKAKAEELSRAADERAAAAHKRALEMERRYRETKEEADTQKRAHAETLEIRDAFGDKGLEAWPMFPGRKVFRTLESDFFDGRVSAEFRVKDSESGERGVTLLMGRLAHSKASEAQAVLFDTSLMSDLDAARWWSNNSHRFEKAKERAEAHTKREMLRATSAGVAARQ